MAGGKAHCARTHRSDEIVAGFIDNEELLVPAQLNPQAPQKLMRKTGMSGKACDEVYVWDLFVRIFHWMLVAAFTVAFLTEDDVLDFHVWAGYVVGALVVLRVAWGFVGSHHARFADFLYRPKAIVEYVGGLLTFCARRYLGHSPGGGAMVVALLASLAVTVASGIVVYGIEERAGPLAGVFASAAVETPQISVRPASASEREGKKSQRAGEAPETAVAKATEELHEFFANFTLALVIVHVGAVLLASFVHRENLTKAMINGYKQRQPSD